MKRLLLAALALAAACSDTARVPVGPLDQLYQPTGMAVHEGRLLVASSNSDLRYDFDRGGTVIALAPSGPGEARITGAERIASFSGELAVADAAACGLPATRVLVPVRGDDAIFDLALGPAGELVCGPGCEVPLFGTFSDPNAIAVACAGGAAGRARAFVGHLRAIDSVAWVTAYDLRTGAVESGTLGGAGPVRGLAYDSQRDRLWATGIATSTPTPLRVVELAGGCSISAPLREGGCPVRDVGTAELPRGVELRGIALSNVESNPAPQESRRVYLSARRYDPDLAIQAGGRTVDQGGELLVAELVEAADGVRLRVVRREPLHGYGVAAVTVFPPRSGGRRDLVAVVVSESGEVVLYDDETGERKVFGADLVSDDPTRPATGAPLLGRLPWSVAVQPVPDGAGNPAVCAGRECARMFVSSFEESVVTAIDVPVDAPAEADFAAVGADGRPVRIGPGVSP